MNTDQIPSLENLILLSIAHQRVIIQMLAESMSNDEKKSKKIFEIALQEVAAQEALLIKSIASHD